MINTILRNVILVNVVADIVIESDKDRILEIMLIILTVGKIKGASPTKESITRGGFSQLR